MRSATDKHQILELVLYLLTIYIPNCLRKSKKNTREIATDVKLFEINDEFLEIYCTTEEDLKQKNIIRPDVKYMHRVNYT